MNFTKMQGCGNDYCYIDCTKQQIENTQELARKISDRHFGVGSDGLILIKPSEKADFFMDMYNTSLIPSPPSQSCSFRCPCYASADNGELPPPTCCYGSLLPALPY